MAVGEVAGEILDAMGGLPIDLLVVFADSSHTGAIEDIAATLRTVLSPRALIGSTASGVLARSTEVEDSPGLSVWACSGLDVTTLRLEPSAIEPAEGWPALATGMNDQNVILLADPFSCPIDRVVESAKRAAPHVAIHGGLASAARGLGGNRLILDGAVYTDGAVGVDLGSANVTSVVSQGCRPIGEPLTVTGAEANVITELAGKRPLDVLEEIAKNASPFEQDLISGGIHIGIAFDDGKVEAFEHGDFLIRQVLGADRSSGAISVGATIELGDTVQFQSRDGASASADLSMLLAAAHSSAMAENAAVAFKPSASAAFKPLAALCFTCYGRGRSLFGRQHHDAELITEVTESRATAGMFCAGELGPVGSDNHIHTFTASTLLFS